MQVEKGESLDAQRRQIELICELEGFDLEHIYVEEGVSAGRPLKTRPEGRQMLNTVTKDDVIVTVKLDRLFRDIEDSVITLKRLKKAGIKLYIRDLGGDVTSDGVSALVFNLLSSVSDFERTRIGERIKDVKAYQKSLGKYLGGSIPFAHKITIKRDDSGKEIKYIEPDTGMVDYITDLREREFSLRMIVWELRKDKDIWTTPSVLSRCFKALAA